MKKTASVIVVILVFIATVFTTISPGIACVGRTLYIGSTGTAEESLMAEMLVTLINERTGTTVKLRKFPNYRAMYKAIKSEDEKVRADIIIENTARGMQKIKITPSGDPQKDFIAVKNGYETDNDLDLIWMPPFGYHVKIGSTTAVTAAVIRHNVLTNFPLLPRVLKKLANAIDDHHFNKMTARISNGAKAHNVAKDFLMRKKII